MTTPWSVPRSWVGETVAILASGPSMTREQAEMVQGKCRVIAVNNSGIPTEVDGVLQPALAPFADVLFAADAKWWLAYKARALQFLGLKVTLRSVLPLREVHSLQQSAQRIFDERPTHLVSGGNSGYQALHLAVHFGVKKVILLGYDMSRADKKRHWFGNHPPRLNSRGNYQQWIQAFDRLAPVLQKKGIEVLNCNPKSALKCFKKVPLTSALQGCQDIDRSDAALSNANQSTALLSNAEQSTG